MIYTVLEISISVALSILVIIVFFERRISVRCRYMLWLVLALRLILPVNFSPALKRIETAPQTVVLRTSGTFPVEVASDINRAEAAKNSTDSADYAPIITVKLLLTWLWAAGGAGFILYHLAVYWRFMSKIKNELIADGRYEDLKIFRCALIETPMLTGFINPVILLPEVHYSDEEREVVLAHEYVHFKRKDLWYKLLLMCANALHWFNPLVYVMVNRAVRDIEYFCDDEVTRGRDMEFKRLYAMTILKTIRTEENT